MNNIKKLREKRHFTQLQVAMKAEITQEALSGIENGRSNPSVEVLKRLAKILETSTDYLLELTNDERVLHESDLTKEENLLLLQFRTLSPASKERVKGYIDAVGEEKCNDR